MFPHTSNGKFIDIDGKRFPVRGVSYGTFAPNRDHWQYPDPDGVAADFAAMSRAGINTVRLYTPPPISLLDEAARHGLRVMAGLSWPQHVAFLDDRKLRAQIRRDVESEMRRLRGHPAVLLVAVGNEVPASIVRWHGQRRTESFLHDLYDIAKSIAPETLVTYANYPPTDYLDLPFLDVVAFNVYLHRERDLRAYIARLHHIAGNRPLLLAEAGADSIREGEDGQASLLAMQLRTGMAGGACGTIAFSWTDEWWRGGQPVTDWAFGLVDRQRRPKRALQAVADLYAPAAPEATRQPQPRVSVVVCAYNAAETLDACLRSLASLTYPDYEVILVNDGSTDATGDIARRHAHVRLIDVPNGGLSVARNIGLAHATGDIVAYIDSDARAEPDWLDYLVAPILTSEFVAAGGPNIVPPDDSWFAQCVARAPGSPNHVLFDDVVAEHIPGCNMAFRRSVLLALDGFNPIFRAAADDVDLCWRLQARGWRIAFAPAAVVWHHHRGSVRAFWRQQVGYGEGEAWLKPLHPEKFSAGRALWRGHIYSALPFIRSLRRTKVNVGVWGLAAFPSVYHHDAHVLSHLPHSGRWQFGSLALLLAAVATTPFGMASLSVTLAGLGLLGLATTAGKCLQYSLATDLKSVATIEGWPRGLSTAAHRAALAVLHFVQPLARAYGRARGFLVPPSHHQHHRGLGPTLPVPVRAQGDGMRRRLRLLMGRPVEDRYWSERWIVVESLLHKMTAWLRLSRAVDLIDIDDGWRASRDFSVATSPFVWLDVRALVEDHGAGKTLLRISSSARPSRLGELAAALLVLCVGAVSAVGTTSDWRLPLVVCGLVLVLTWSVAVWRVGRTADVVREAVAKLTAEEGLIELTPAHVAAPSGAARVRSAAAEPSISREG